MSDKEIINRTIHDKFFDKCKKGNDHAWAYSELNDRTLCNVCGILVPKYSTDIAEAFKVIDFLTSKNYIVNLSIEKREVFVDIQIGQFDIYPTKGDASSVPLAICEAALKMEIVNER